MARLENDNGTYVDIKPIAYEFPAGDNSVNWLKIRLKAHDGNYEWETIDPALETFEMIRLIGWLRELVSHDTTAEANFYATEPCVEFRAKQQPEGLELTVSLGYNFLPPQISSKKNSYRDRVNLMFTNNRGNVLRFAAQLEKEMSAFPIRSEQLDDR